MAGPSVAPGLNGKGDLSQCKYDVEIGLATTGHDTVADASVAESIVSMSRRVNPFRHKKLTIIARTVMFDYQNKRRRTIIYFLEDLVIRETKVAASCYHMVCLMSSLMFIFVSFLQGSRIIGVTCSTNFAQEYNLVSTVSSNKRKYICNCKGSSNLFYPTSTSQKTCKLHYWSCPIG